MKTQNYCDQAHFNMIPEFTIILCLCLTSWLLPLGLISYFEKQECQVTRTQEIKETLSLFVIILTGSLMNIFVCYILEEHLRKTLSQMNLRKILVALVVLCVFFGPKVLSGLSGDYENYLAIPIILIGVSLSFCSLVLFALIVVLWLFEGASEEYQ